MLRALGLLAVLLCLFAIAVQAAKPPLTGLAVFPFTPQRGVDKERQFSEFLQQEIIRGVLRWGRVPVLTAETATLWQQKLGLGALQGPDGAQLKQMRVQAALHGTTQLVAGLVLVKVRLTGARGDMLLGRTVTQRIELGVKLPKDMLDDLLHEVFSALFRGDSPQAPPQPRDWELLWRFQTLKTRHLPPDATESHKLLRALQMLGQGPGQALAARIALTQARLLLELGVLDTEDGAKRKQFLHAALGHATKAAVEEPWNAEALALKGEILYFLQQEFEARTEASVARLKNPLSGLAHALLGFTAGLSTGEAGASLRQALALNPFLRGANRPNGVAPFQNGVLEPLFARWDALAADRAGKKARRENTSMNRAIALFEQKKWRQAEKALVEAAQADEYSYQPELYLARIQIETENAHGAAERLRKLVAEFPQEAEVYYYYGIALENSRAYAGAMDAFQRALTEKPGDERALYHLGTAAMGLGDWSRALDALRLLLTRNDRHAEGWFYYGVVNARAEQWKTADDAFQRALQLKPGWERVQKWRERVRKRQKAKP